jgi:hypothetical protein
MSTSDVKERVQTPCPSHSFTRTDSPVSIQHHRNEIGGPSRSPSQLAEIHSRPYTATSAPTALESQIQEHAHRRPSSAFAGSIIESRSSFPSLKPLTPPTYLQRPDSATPIMEYPQSSAFPSASRLSTNEDDPRGRTMSPDCFSLPPRRELPFQRSSLPRSSGSDTVRPSSRPSTGLMGPPPLPARVATLRPSSAQASFPDSELPPLPQPTVVENTRQRSPHTPTSDAGAFARASNAIFEESNTPSSSSPLPYGRSSLPFSSTHATSDDTRREHAPATFLSPPKHDTLSSYAMQTDEQRREALNAFILQNLDSDAFITLVEDMETCWARVALGL